MYFLIQESLSDPNGPAKNLSYSRFFDGTPTENVLSAYIFGKYPHAVIQFPKPLEASALITAAVQGKFTIIDMDKWSKAQMFKYINDPNDKEFIEKLGIK
ncbi:MAG: hypothetical protein IPP32_12860 [Bacteroidetes bacterium]|nr:hypothetical protein [Bacteroidota bacterium]